MIELSNLDLGNMSDIETMNIRFDYYKLDEQDLLILGEKPSQKQVNDFITIYNSPSLLIDFLKAGEEIKNIYNQDEGLEKQETQIKCSKILIDMCHKYGLIYSDPIFISKSKHGLKVLNVAYSLLHLFFAFDDWLNEDRINLSFMNSPALHDEQKIELQYCKERNNYKLVFSVYSPVSVACFQLKLLIAGELNENNIIRCAGCSKIILVEHGNRKYCDMCQLDQNKNDVKNLRKRLEDKASTYIIGKYFNNDLEAERILEIEKDYIRNTIGKSTPFNKKKINEWLNRQ